MPLHQFLLQLFVASPNYCLAVSLQKLRVYGGISCLLNNLSINHRQLSYVFKLGSSDTQRQQVSAPVRNKILQKDYLLESVLLYLLSLSFFVKLLLYTNGLRVAIDLHTEIIGFVFLVFIIVSRSRRVTNSQFLQTQSQDVCAKQEKLLQVRRKEEELLLPKEEIQQGDIVAFSMGDTVNVDAIVLKVNEGETSKDKQEGLTLNEEETNTTRTKCYKHSVWIAERSQELDPFIMANSKVLHGQMWVLVCLTGKSTSSSRVNSELQVGGMAQLSKVSRQVGQVTKGVVGVLVFLLSLRWLGVQQEHHYDVFLELVYIISSLLLFLSYVNHNEMFSFIAKYFQEQLQTKSYRILNPKLLERLGAVDLIVIEDDCLSQTAGGHLLQRDQLSVINKAADVKFVTSVNRNGLYALFGDDVNTSLIFQADDNVPLRQRLKQLGSCKFMRSDYETFRNYYLRLLQEMHFQLLYCSRNRTGIVGQQLITVKCTTCSLQKEPALQGEWVRVASGEQLQTVLVDLLEKSKIYGRLRQCYYAVLLNSCMELLILSGWALAGCMLDLNLNLLIIYLNRNRPLQLYKSIVRPGAYLAPKTARIPQQLPMWLQFNVVLAIYYVYMMGEIYDSSDRQFELFLLLMGIRLFRIEGLHANRRQNSRKLRRFAYKTGGLVMLIVVEAGLRLYQQASSDYITQSMDILLLPVILIIYSIFF